MKNSTIIIMTIGICFLWSCASNTKEKQQPIAKHVVVIGFDGLSPDGLENANTPVFDSIMANGASTMHARAVLPSSSSTNWASMIMGAGPEQHGITSNAWEKNNLTLPPITQEENFIFPTIFNLTRKHKKDAEIGVIYDWTGFGRLFEKSAVDYDVNAKDEEETAKLAVAYINQKKPTLTFVHFDHVDHAGHEFGHGTPEYYTSVEKADLLLGQVLKGIEKAGIAEETVVVISSDHGGLGKGHGGESLKEVEIPFIVYGASVKKGHRLTYPVYQYDNAATVAFILGIPTPMAWIGKPIKNAFDGYHQEDAYPILEQLKAPIIYPKAVLEKKAGGLFSDSTRVKLEHSNTEASIKYTLDGTVPDKGSTLYTSPFLLQKNTVVKAAMFSEEGAIISPVEEAFFRIKDSKTEAAVAYKVYYLDNLTSVPSLQNKQPDVSGKSFEITSDEVKAAIKANTAVSFTTTLNIEKEGTYTFYTRSDDGSKLWIDGEEIVDNDGDHGVKEASGRVYLKEGVYTLEVIWFNGGGGGWLDVFYKEEQGVKQILPSTMFIP